MTEKTPRTGAWTTRRFLALLGSILIWAFIAIDIWYLWPTALGGSTSLVIVSGESMEPTYYNGDLVIARELEPSVGDVIVYTPEGYGDAQIVHRIIGGDGEDGWIVQGDNNSFIDPFEPTNDDVRGVVLVSYAHVGLLTGLLLNPILWAALILAALVMLLWVSGDDDDDDEDEDLDGEAAGEVQPSEVAESESASAAGSGPGGIVTRVLAVFALTGALVIGTSGVTAFASGIAVTTPSAPSVFQLAPCWTAGWSATVAGSPSAGNYTQVQMSSIPAACQGQTFEFSAYNASHTLVATATATPTSGTFTFTTGSYSGAAVSEIWVKVGGWPVKLTWTPPAPTGPSVPTATCQALTPGNQVNTSYPCTVSVTPNSAPPWDYDNGTKLWNYTFNVTWTAQPPNTSWKWLVTIDHSPVFTPQWIGLDYNPGVVLGPGYSCAQQPVMVIRSTSRDVWGATINMADGPAPSYFSGQSLCN